MQRKGLDRSKHIGKLSIYLCPSFLCKPVFSRLRPCTQVNQHFLDLILKDQVFSGITIDTHIQFPPTTHFHTSRTLYWLLYLLQSLLFLASCYFHCCRVFPQQSSLSSQLGLFVFASLCLDFGLRNAALLDKQLNMIFLCAIGSFSQAM